MRPRGGGRRLVGRGPPVEASPRAATMLAHPSGCTARGPAAALIDGNRLSWRASVLDAVLRARGWAACEVTVRRQADRTEGHADTSPAPRCLEREKARRVVPVGIWSHLRGRSPRHPTIDEQRRSSGALSSRTNGVSTSSATSRTPRRPHSPRLTKTWCARDRPSTGFPRSPTRRGETGLTPA